MSDPITKDSKPEAPSFKDDALKIFVYAPIGAALRLLHEIPNFAALGKEETTKTISNAKAIGEATVAYGKSDIERRLKKNRSKSVDEPEEQPSPPSSSELRIVPSAQTVPVPLERTPEVTAAITDYDMLSASQVVRRLESLDAEQLARIKEHESSHRHRKTILNKTSQLLGTQDVVGL